MSMRKLYVSFLIVLLPLLLTGCYNRGPITPDAWDLTAQQLDSISFYTTHHYTQNYNFVVTGDSLVVVAQQPEDMAIPDVVSSEIETVGMEMQKDSITLRKNEHIVVADIKTVPADRFLLRCPFADLLGILCDSCCCLWCSKVDEEGGKDCAF